ncbi:MAG: hypothetical protein HZA17_07350 [Nitrospirae bacterium]|nr:hypothetical protein [Nitrospirota bacterium]
MVIAFHILNPIMDYDFFWHLKTGEWIWEHKALPEKDPFAYTTPPETTGRERLILTSYWMSEVLYHKLHLLAGFRGIVALRVIILGLFLCFMSRLSYGDRVVRSGLILIFFVVMLEMFPLERPQVFSFLFFLLLLRTIESIRFGSAQGRVFSPLTMLPLMMLGWANMHGGYLVGQAVIILFILVDGLKFLHPSLRPPAKNTYRRLVIAGVLGLIFSLVNPNTYHGWAGLLKTTAMDNTEYYSAVRWLQYSGNFSILLYWFILILTITAGLVRGKDNDPSEIGLLAATGLFSFISIRYIPFFMIAAFFFTVKLFAGGMLLKFGRLLILTVSLASAFFSTADERFDLDMPAIDMRADYRMLPVAATEFVAASDLKGNMYNLWDWGGYLIWRLGPQRKVFHDGRQLDARIYEQTDLIDNAAPQELLGKPMWKAYLEAYGIKYMIIPYFLPRGEILPLAEAALHDVDWALVYSDLTAMVFVRNDMENLEVIEKYSQSKDFVR